MMSGGCLCGAVRYETRAEPAWTVICYCRDCQRASGSGYVPVIGVRRADLGITGETRSFEVSSASGGPATRHFCPRCGSLIFGGIVGVDTSHTIYAGSLDDPTVFRPTIAIFNRDRPVWALMPPGLTVFETMPS